MTDTTNTTDPTTPPPAAPTTNVHAVSARKSDLDILNWVNNMIPSIQQYAGRTDQLLIRIEWTPDAALFNAVYPEDVAQPEGTETAPAEGGTNEAAP